MFYIQLRPMTAQNWPAGFEILGTHRRLGRFHDGRWCDVVLMERRSRVAGVD